MTKPTPEQVAQWAREAGMEQDYDCFYSMPDEIYVTLADIHRLVTRAMAEQAEADSRIAFRSHSREHAANAIRANAPKVTT